MIDKDVLKEELTLDDINLILVNDLGSEPPISINRAEGIWAYQTVCHNISGGKHKLYYYKSSKTFHCYTECGETFDIFELVCRAKFIRGKDLSFGESVRYVAEKTNRTASNVIKKHNGLNPDADIISDWDMLNKYKKHKDTINAKRKSQILDIYDPIVLERFYNVYHSDWLDENITMEAMKAFEISFLPIRNQIIIPHYNIHNELIGIRARNLNEEALSKGYKYVPVTVQGKEYGHPLSSNLYGLHKTKKAIKRLKRVYIFEAEKSVLHMEGFYGRNNCSVAVCGSNIFKGQIKTLLKLGAEEFIFCMDKDFEGSAKQENDNGELVFTKKAEKQGKRLRKMASLVTPYAKAYIVWDKNDLTEYKDSPCDRGQEIFEQLVKEKIMIKTK